MADYLTAEEAGRDMPTAVALARVGLDMPTASATLSAARSCEGSVNFTDPLPAPPVAPAAFDLSFAASRSIGSICFASAGARVQLYDFPCSLTTQSQPERDPH
jgi:hypothetical protein